MENNNNTNNDNRKKKKQEGRFKKKKSELMRKVTNTVLDLLWRFPFLPDCILKAKVSFLTEEHDYSFTAP